MGPGPGPGGGGPKAAASASGPGAGSRRGSAMASGAGGGGGGGGGKIRTRRCHQGPVKPYQQGRPPRQVGPGCRGGRGPRAVRAGAPRGADGRAGGRPERGAGARAAGAATGSGLGRPGLRAHVGLGLLPSPGPGAFRGRRRAGKEIVGLRSAAAFWRLLRACRSSCLLRREKGKDVVGRSAGAVRSLQSAVGSGSIGRGLPQ